MKVLVAVLLFLGFATVASPATATPDHDKIQFCHKVNGQGNTGNGYNLIETDPASILQKGHGSHPDDIIPAFDGFAGQGDASWIANNCADPNGNTDPEPEPKPEQPAAITQERDVEKAPDCDAGTVLIKHQERTSVTVFDEELWEWIQTGWTKWKTVDKTTRDATDEECPVVVPPVDPDPKPNPEPQERPKPVDKPQTEPVSVPIDESATVLPNTGGANPGLAALSVLLLASGVALVRRGRI